MNNAVGNGQLYYSLFDGLGCQGNSKPMERRNIFLELKLVAGGNKLASISVDLDPREIVFSPIFHTRGNASAEIAFCVRFRMYTGDYNSENAIEANFLETPVQVRLNLKSGANLTIGEIKGGE